MCVANLMSLEDSPCVYHKYFCFKYQYDLMYKVAEAATLGKNKAKRKHKDTNGEKKETETEESDVKINETHSATQKGKDGPKSIANQRAVKIPPKTSH